MQTERRQLILRITLIACLFFGCDDKNNKSNAPQKSSDADGGIDLDGGTSSPSEQAIDNAHPSDVVSSPSTDTYPVQDAGVALVDIDTGMIDDAGITYPGSTWPTADPVEHGFDTLKLQQASDLAANNDTNCLLITHQGYIVSEWYFHDWDVSTEQNVFSVTKSITSILVGIAQDQGALNINDFASDYISEWVGTESEEVTIKQLLSNVSGRYWGIWEDYLAMAFTETDKTAYAVSLSQQFPPDTIWEYNNSAVQTLERVMINATGMPIAEFADLHLFGPLQMNSTMSLDGAGNTVVFSDMRASCRDLAKVGYMTLRKGVWGTDRIVSEAWIEEATTPSSDLNRAYGYLLWLNREGHWIGSSTTSGKPEGDGKMMPDVPENTVVARGLQSQFIAIVPDNELVITRIGGSDDALEAVLAGGSGSDTEFINSLIASVIDAIN